MSTLPQLPTLPGLGQPTKKKANRRTNPRVTIKELNEQGMAALEDKGIAKSLKAKDNRSTFIKVLDWLDLPRNVIAQAVASLAGLDPKDVKGGTGAGGLKRVYMSDVLRHLNVRNPIIRSVVGFAGDVLIDPLTYASAAATTGLRVGRHVPRLLRSGTRVLDDVARTGRVTPQLAKALGMTLKGAEKMAANISQKSLTKSGRKLLMGKRGGALTRLLAKNVSRTDDVGAAARGFFKLHGLKGRPLLRVPWTDLTVGTIKKGARAKAYRAMDVAGKGARLLGESAKAAQAANLVARVKVLGNKARALQAQGDKVAAKAILKQRRPLLKQLRSLASDVGVKTFNRKAVQQLDDLGNVVGEKVKKGTVSVNKLAEGIQAEKMSLFTRPDAPDIMKLQRRELLGRAGPTGTGIRSRIQQELRQKFGHGPSKMASQLTGIKSNMGIEASVRGAEGMHLKMRALDPLVRKWAKQGLGKEDEIRRIVFDIIDVGKDAQQATFHSTGQKLAKGFMQSEKVQQLMTDPEVRKFITEFWDDAAAIRKSLIDRGIPVAAVDDYIKRVLTKDASRAVSAQQARLGVPSGPNTRTQIVEMAPPAGRGQMRPPTTDTRGGQHFFHGAKKEFSLAQGGELVKDKNIYGPGLYTTDDFKTAASYTRGREGSRVYRAAENIPANLYDLDAPIDTTVKAALQSIASHQGPYGDLVASALEALPNNASLANIMDEMRAASRNFNLPTYEVTELFEMIIEPLKQRGYGGFTHVGGKLAGKGKRLHRVNIYWNPADMVSMQDILGPGDAVMGKGPRAFLQTQAFEPSGAMRPKFDKLAKRGWEFTKDDSGAIKKWNMPAMQMEQRMQKGGLRHLKGAAKLDKFYEGDPARSFGSMVADQERALAGADLRDMLKPLSASVGKDALATQPKFGGMRKLSDTIFSKDNPLRAVLGDDLASRSFPNEVADAMDMFGEMFKGGEKLSELLDLTDKTMSWFKRWALFHSGYVTRNVWQNGLGTLMSGASPVRALHWWTGKTSGKIRSAIETGAYRKPAWLAKEGKEIIRVGGMRFSLADLAKYAADHNMAGAGMSTAEFTFGPARKAGRLAASGRGLGRVASETGELVRKWNAKLENRMRIGTWLTHLESGMTKDRALTQTLRAMPDLAMVTPWEKKYMTRLFPWWRWMKSNGALQLFHYLPNQPAWMASMSKFRNFLEGASYAWRGNEGSVPQELRPDWLQEQQAAQVGGDAEKGSGFLLRSWFPFEEAQTLGASLMEPTAAARWLGSQARPGVKAIAEIATGKDIFRGRDVEPISTADVFTKGWKAPAGKSGTALDNLLGMRPIKEGFNVAERLAQGKYASAAGRAFIGGAIQPMSAERGLKELDIQTAREITEIRREIKYAKEKGNEKLVKQLLRDLMRVQMRRRKLGLSLPKATTAQFDQWNLDQYATPR